MLKRIIGEEIEWNGGYWQISEGKWLSIGGIADKIIKEVSFNYKHCAKNSIGIFLPNGARVYSESTGQHFETTSPECSSAREVVKFDKWSELFVCRVKKMMKEKHDIDIAFYKKSTDVNLENANTNALGSTRGCHENYFSDKKIKDWLSHSYDVTLRPVSTRALTLIDPEINYFILFLITRQIFTGSGGIMPRPPQTNQGFYEISPRTNHIDAIISSISTSSGSSGRPIIHIRNESLSDDDKYFRNHLILGDANMADLSIFMKFGTTSAIIEMLEENFWDRRLCLNDIFEATKIFKAISKDLTLSSVPIRLKDGKSYTALQIQRKFCNNWRRYLKYTHQSSEKAEVCRRWREILGRLEIDDEKLYSQLDWKIKLRLIYDFIDRKGLPLNHEKVVNLDKVYHSPDPEKSFYYKLKNRPGAQFESLVSENEILDADKNPPENRAKLRVNLKKIFDNLGLTSAINWNYVTFKLSDSSQTEHKIYMIDPCSSSVLSLNLPINIDSIERLNALAPGTIVF